VATEAGTKSLQTRKFCPLMMYLIADAWLRKLQAGASLRGRLYTVKSLQRGTFLSRYLTAARCLATIRLRRRGMARAAAPHLMRATD